MKENRNSRTGYEILVCMLRTAFLGIAYYNYVKQTVCATYYINSSGKYVYSLRVLSFDVAEIAKNLVSGSLKNAAGFSWINSS